jgi:hypothetical protein
MERFGGLADSSKCCRGPFVPLQLTVFLFFILEKGCQGLSKEIFMTGRLQKDPPASP